MIRLKKRATFSVGSGEGFDGVQPASRNPLNSPSPKVKTEGVPLRLHPLQKKVGVIRHD